MTIKKAVFIFAALLLSGCSASASESADQPVTSSETAVTEETDQPDVYVPTDSDKIVSKWFEKDIFDEESFPDINNYRYYARTLGQDKDYFLSPEMWEVYYSEKININKDIDEKEIYLIRLNPYKLLELYAENNNVSVDELCEKISVKKEQLYYNWGYNPASVDYMKNHKDNTVTYSEEEKKIFGACNTEARSAVMRTHILTAESGAKYADYSGTLPDNLIVYRRDTLSAFTENGRLYSDFSDAERSPAFKLNGIGIRCVIPLSLPNAYANAADSGFGDENITPMINVSPYAYGCTDEDKIDIVGILEMIKAADKKK